MKIGLITDTHYGVRNDAPIFYEYFKNSIELFLKALKEQEITHIIHLGDLFDRRKYLNFVTANRCREDFLQKLEDMQIETHIIAGNHDIYYKNTARINSLDEIIGNRYKYIKVYSNPEEITIGGHKILLLPWITPENEKESFDAVNTTKANLVMAHLQLDGFEMHKGIVSMDGYGTSPFSRFDLVCTGHFHHRSSRDNICYLGAFAQFIWSDFSDARGFNILDLETNKINFHKNPYSIFGLYKYDDLDQTFVDKVLHGSIDLSRFRNKYVKVVCVNRTNPFIFDKFTEALYKVGPIDITILDSEIESKEESEEEELDQADDTPTMINKFVDGLTTSLDPVRIKNILQGHYTNALNLDRAL